MSGWFGIRFNNQLQSADGGGNAEVVGIYDADDSNRGRLDCHKLCKSQQVNLELTT